MRVYLVRHGESEGNVTETMQGSDEILTEDGRAQAAFVAKRLAKLPIEHILCSTHVRTRETAAIINEVLDRPIEYSDLLIERRHASEFVNKHRSEPGMEEKRALMWKHFHEPGWRYGDEENFEDIKERGLRALELFAASGKEHLLVVTHGIFMRAIVACALFGQDLTSHEYQKFLISLLTRNTGITVLEWRESVFEGHMTKRWCLITWNDHAHLESI